MADWQSGGVEANGIRLHYTRTGGEGPPLVLAHGVTDDGLCWTPGADAGQRAYDVIIVDARGHGRLDAPETGYDAATQAADLRGVITGLGLHKPAVLGHSMGAVTTLGLAGLYPDVPGAILLEDPPGWWAISDPLIAEEDRAAGTWASAVIRGRNPDDECLVGMQAWFTELKRKTREQLIAEQRAATPSWLEAELGPWADSKLWVNSNVLTIFNPATPQSVDWPSIVSRITCPALLITADPSCGAILKEAAVAALRALVPHLQIAHIAEAGHNVRREQFARYIDIVRAFLAEWSTSRAA